MADAASPGNPANPASGPTPGSGREPLFRWTLSFLEPYRKRVALLVVLLLSEIALGALQPWPLAIVIDYVLTPLNLGGKAFPARLQPWIDALTHTITSRRARPTPCTAWMSMRTRSKTS